MSVVCDSQYCGPHADEPMLLDVSLCHSFFSPSSVSCFVLPVMPKEQNRVLQTASFYEGSSFDADTVNSRQSMLRPAPVQGSSRNTTVNTRSAVSIFERWIKQPPYQDHRRIEEIPPVELDRYLEVFWGAVKRQDGADYNPKSLSQLRTRLELHLKTCGYPMSIVTESAVFAKSLLAYKRRTESKRLSNFSNVMNLDFSALE